MIKKFENFHEDIDPFGEEDWGDNSIHDFKIGDIVVVDYGADWMRDKKGLNGKKGKIIQIIPDFNISTGDLVTVEFFNNIGGHDGHNNIGGKYGHCWCFSERNYTYLINQLKKVE